MAAPRKSVDELKSNRFYVYVDESLNERLKAESIRQGGRSVSDILRAVANEKFPAPSLVESLPNSKAN